MLRTWGSSSTRHRGARRSRPSRPATRPATGTRSSIRPELSYGWFPKTCGRQHTVESGPVPAAEGNRRGVLAHGRNPVPLLVGVCPYTGGYDSLSRGGTSASRRRRSALRLRWMFGGYRSSADLGRGRAGGGADLGAGGPISAGQRRIVPGGRDVGSPDDRWLGTGRRSPAPADRGPRRQAGGAGARRGRDRRHRAGHSSRAGRGGRDPLLALDGGGGLPGGSAGAGALFGLAFGGRPGLHRCVARRRRGGGAWRALGTAARSRAPARPAELRCAARVRQSLPPLALSERLGVARAHARRQRRADRRLHRSLVGAVRDAARV